MIYKNIFRIFSIFAVSGLLSLLIFNTAHAWPILFKTKVTFTVGNTSWAVVIRDFNGDGRFDIASVNRVGNNVSILLGNHDGTFANAVNYAVGTNPYAVVVGDFDGDNVIDLATANADDNNVSVLLGNGNGTFAAAVNYGVQNSPSALAVGDINSDGEQDLVVANQFSDSCSTLLGNGDGTFAAALNKAAGGFVDGVTIADFNGDNNLDVATAALTDDKVDVLLGRGDGTYDDRVEYAVQVQPRAISSADLNDDNKIDLVAANGVSNSVSVLLGNGDGTFAAAVNYAAGNSSEEVLVADLNGDNKKDLVVTDTGDESFSVLLGNGDGTFAAAVNYAFSVTGIRGAAAADLNFDDYVDLVFSAEQASIFLGNGDGTFNDFSTYNTGDNPQQVVSEDFTGDGKKDLAVVNYNDDNISVLLNQGSGTFAAAVNYGSDSNPYSLAAGDFNGDGKKDLAALNESSDNVSILLGNGDGSFAAKVDYAVGSYPEGIATSDLNGDGVLDLAVADQVDDDISVLLGNGDGTFAAAVSYGTGDEPYRLMFADFNADNKQDIAVANIADDTVSVLLGNGDGTFAAKTDYATADFPLGIGTGDFDSDGKTDIAVACFNSLAVSILKGNGDGTFAAKIDYAIGGRESEIAVADVDFDGKKDILTVGDRFAVLVNEGDGTFDVRIYSDLASAGSVIAAELNNDNRLDAVISTPGSDKLVVYTNIFNPGAVLVESSGNTVVSEGGATDTYTVRLRSQPKANVVVTPAPDAQVTVNPASLTFTSANWDAAQTVTVTAVDDTAVEGAHVGQIAHNAVSTDGNYSGVVIPSISVTITDNDTAQQGGGGVAFSGASTLPPTAPEGGFKVTINGGALTTSDRSVNLTLTGGSNTIRMAISNYADFNDAGQENYATIKSWDLCSKAGSTVKSETCPNGTYTVYAKFFTSSGQASGIVSASINYFNSTNTATAQTLPAVTVATPAPSQTSVTTLSITLPYNTYTFKRNLYRGSVGADVKELQKFLNKNNFIVAKSGYGSPGKETTYFGYLTRSALARFQKANAMKIFGRTTVPSLSWGKLDTKTRAYVNGLIQ